MGYSEELIELDGLVVGLFSADLFLTNLPEWSTTHAKHFLDETNKALAPPEGWKVFMRRLMTCLNACYFGGTGIPKNVPQATKTRLLAISLFMEGRNLRSFGVTPKAKNIPAALLALLDEKTIESGPWPSIMSNHFRMMNDGDLMISKMLSEMPQKEGGKKLDITEIAAWAKKDLQIPAHSKTAAIEALRAHFDFIAVQIKQKTLNRNGWDEFFTCTKKLLYLWVALDEEYNDAKFLITTELGEQDDAGFKDLEEAHRLRAEKFPIAVNIYLCNI